jgi:hypothetical protein
LLQKSKRALSVPCWVVHLPSKHKALNPQNHQRKREKKKYKRKIAKKKICYIAQTDLKLMVLGVCHHAQLYELVLLPHLHKQQLFNVSLSLPLFLLPSLPPSLFCSTRV